MQHELAKLLAEVGEELGEEVRVYENYSGRGMLGSSTTGLVIPSTGMLAVLMYHGSRRIAEGIADGSLEPDLNPFRTDNLGYDAIIY